jgi:DNA-binding MarR family transcriptional regulator
LLAQEVTIPPLLAEWTAPLLSRAALRIRTRFEEKLAPLGLRAKHFGVLTLVQHEPRSQVEIGRDLLVDRTTMVALVDDLVRLSLVERGRHPQDRRAHAVTITARGREVLPRAAEIARETEHECLSALSSSEQEQLRALLARLL